MSWDSVTPPQRYKICSTRILSLGVFGVEIFGSHGENRTQLDAPKIVYRSVGRQSILLG